MQKAADITGAVTEIIKQLPYTACVSIYNKFKEMCECQDKENPKQLATKWASIDNGTIKADCHST